MNFKWYISTLVIILSLLGFVHQEQSVLPNQEIVFQFKNIEVSKNDAQTTIAIVKKELQKAGVSNIQVKENDNGKLKITYYSDADVDIIKRILLKRIRSELGASDDDDSDPFNVPIENGTVAYNIDVYEIQSTNDIDSGINGINVLEVEAKADRFFKPKIYTSLAIYRTSKVEDDSSKFKWCNRIALTIDTTLGEIPEVRAGPLS